MSEYAPLTLHVPEPAVRPGDTPDFSNVRIPQAGSVPRPEIDADSETVRDLAYSIIRVLNRKGERHMRLKGREQRCAALDGELGVWVSCTIYQLRPAGCSRGEPGSKECLRDRRERGIS